MFCNVIDYHKCKTSGVVFMHSYVQNRPQRCTFNLKEISVKNDSSVVTVKIALLLEIKVIVACRSVNILSICHIFMSMS